MEWFQLAVEWQKPDVGGIEDVAPLTKLSYNKYDADDKTDDSLDLGGAITKVLSQLNARHIHIDAMCLKDGVA